jgi:hypothetical protein
MITTTAELAGRMARATLAAGGATMATDGTVPVTGYAVALPQLEETHPASDTTELAARIGAYVDAHAAELEGRYVGAWVDGGTVYLDTVEIIADRATAELAGIAAGQLAIFDLAAGAEIRLAPQVTP